MVDRLVLCLTIGVLLDLFFCRAISEGVEEDWRKSGGREGGSMGLMG